MEIQSQRLRHIILNEIRVSKAKSEVIKRALVISHAVSSSLVKDQVIGTVLIIKKTYSGRYDDLPVERDVESMMSSEALATYPGRDKS